jgi:cytochrome c oxidase cbb3-type subunit I/II
MAIDRLIWIGVLAAFLSGGVATAQESDPSRLAPALNQAALIGAGKLVYERYCAGCHGLNGDGAGPAARWLNPKPRNFQRAAFKFRTTPSGALPTDEDLHRTITRGIFRSSMPAWFLMPETDKVAVIEYLKTFSDRWQDSYEYDNPIRIPDPPEFVGTPESVARGQELYTLMKCANCHGEGGRGDGPSAPDLKDDQGRPIVPFDFTSGVLKGGPGLKDIYRTFSTGLDGTPMPSYYDSLPNDDDRWHLVSYIISLRAPR